jgi:dipeptide/tripeptide permease
MVGLLAAAGVGLFSVSAPVVADVFRHLMYAIAVLYFGYILLFGGLNGTEKRRVGVMIVLFVCSALFWAGFEQAGTTFNLFARDLTDRSFLGRLLLQWGAPCHVVSVLQFGLHHCAVSVLCLAVARTGPSQS